MLEAIHNFFDFFPDWLHVFFISFVPVIELRGAIPYGVLVLGMNALETLLISIAGSMVPAPVVLYLGEKILNAMANSKNRFFHKLGEKIVSRSLKRKDKIARLSYIGLFIFIAIPLPGTGVWTGCVIAALLGLSPVKAMLAALAGTAGAGIIVSLLVQGGRILVSM